MSKEIMWPLRILQSFCPDHLYEEIEGDLIQSFNKDVKTFGEKRAKRKLVWNAIRFFRPGILLRNKFSFRSSNMPMFQNYFKTTYRHVAKSKLNFAFKLGGLTLSLLSFLVIAIYISFHLSFDSYHQNSNRIYRVNSERKENGSQEKYAIVPLSFASLIQKKFAEVDVMTKFRGSNQSHVRYNQKVLSCNIVSSDSSLFDVFTIKLLSGGNALAKPNTIVLTKSFANKLFGEENPIHQVVTLTNKSKLFEVTAVIEDFPVNSHMVADAIIPIEDDKSRFSVNSIVSPVDFVDQSTTLYLRLKDENSAMQLAAKFDALVDRYIGRKGRVESGFHLSLQPLEDIYLSPRLNYEFMKKGSSFYLYVFSVLGVFLLIIAIVNYVNLSIADFNVRWREIGVRKVMGAYQNQIAFQLIVESACYVLLSLILSVCILYFIFPIVVSMVDANLTFKMLFDSHVIIMISVTILLLIVLSAATPFYQLIKSNISMKLSGSQFGGYRSSMGRVLLGVQFSISVLCIAATLVIGKQLKFIHTKDLGFDRKNLIVILVPEDFSVRKMQSLTSEIKKIPGVASVSNSSFKIGGSYWRDWYSIEIDGKMKSMELYEVFSDDALFGTLGMKLLDGRLFDSSNPADSGSAFVINESAAKELGWKDPVGKRILTHPEEPKRWEGTVVGVVKDINICPLYEKVQPLVMRLPWQNNYPEFFVYVRFDGDFSQSIKLIEKKYSEILPGYTLDYDNVDTFFNSRYEKEDKAYGTLLFATVIILLVSSIGIFSLSVYMSARRMKEFGIRKVLGAKAAQIAILHVSYFAKIAVIANAIALPIAYWFMKEWLDGFAYKTELNGLMFLIVTTISFILVITSGAYSAIKAAKMNPVDVIKNQ